MSIASSARIHPTAIISANVEIGDNVEVGAYSVIEGNIKIGADCVIRAGAYIYGNVTMGKGNQVFTGAVLGEVPQHLKYNGEPTGLEIGDGNIFREQVTIHRGTTHSMVTRIGNNNFIMANSHVAHDCVVGNRCILTNGALIGGHTILEDNVVLSGNSAVHQFIRVGRLAMLSGCSTTTKDVPPFITQQEINNVVGINVVGMRRAGLSNEQIGAVREAFRIIFRRGLILPTAVQTLEAELGTIDVVQEMITFLRRCKKGINYMRGHGAAAEAA
jgi:UDP-N-acetylglucosamine acyltransferase